MMDTIARTGSFAAAARELGKVPSALTYSVRQLEEALDVLLFDRRSRQAQSHRRRRGTAHEGRRLLQEMDAVANRVRRVATGWETQLSDRRRRRDLAAHVVRAVRGLLRARPAGRAGSGDGGPGTRLRLRTEVLAGTWEALVSGQADLAIGVGLAQPPPGGIEHATARRAALRLRVAPHHPLAAVDRADRRRPSCCATARSRSPTRRSACRR